jgi:dienelactone hydrolase
VNFPPTYSVLSVPPCFFITMLSGWLGAAENLESEAARFAAPGPYAVGVRTVLLVDRSRRDEFARGPRMLLTEIWYPAVEESRGKSKVKFSEFFGPYKAEAGRFLKRDLDSIDRDFRSLAVRDAPLRSPQAGSWTPLLFSHGNGGFRHQNAFQAEHLASHGFVVAAPDHTGNAGLTPLPGGSVPYDRNGRGRSAADRPLDIRFLIDRLIAADDPAVEWLRGAVDGEAVGVLGHSFGGFCAVRLAEEEPRVKAILPMTVAFVGRPTSIPTLVMLGAEDRTVGNVGNIASRGYYLGCSGPRHLFVLRRGGHFTFTQISVIDPNWGDGVGRGKGRDGREVDFIPVDLSREIIDAYTLAFFDRYLRKGEAAGRFLATNPWPEELEWWSGGRLIGKPSAGAGRQQRRARL